MSGENSNPKIKKLILMRHSYALDLWQSGVTKDGLRPLSEEGIAQAGKTADLIKSKVSDVDKIIASPLVRASQTAEIVASKFGLKVIYIDKIASGIIRVEELKDLFFEEMRDVNSMIVVGHNPTISQVASMVDGKWMSFEPAGFIILEIPVK